MAANLFANTESGIILAADVDADKLGVLLKAAEDIPEVVGIKIGVILALRSSLPRVVEYIAERAPQLSIIYDHQKAGTDIPESGQPFMRVMADANVRAAIIFPHSGPRVLEAFVQAAVENDVEPIVGLSMTHQGFHVCQGGYISDDAPELIRKDAVRLGVTNFVLPGNGPEWSAEQASMLPHCSSIFMPGIGTQGGSIAAALRIAPHCKLFPIVGSTVYKAKDMRAAINALACDLREAQRARSVAS